MQVRAVHKCLFLISRMHPIYILFVVDRYLEEKLVENIRDFHTVNLNFTVLYAYNSTEFYDS